MICLFADAAAISSQNPVKMLSGNYHPTAGNGNLMQVITSGMGERALPINGDALTVALDVVQIWAVMLTLSFTLIIFFFLAFCVCAKRENSYGDFENTQGITTVKVCRNGAENGVHMAPLGTSALGSPKATDETSEASSRYTHKRELPAIPTNASGSNRESMPTQSSASESLLPGGKPVGGVQVLPAGAMKSGGRAAVIKESVSISSDAHDGRKKNVKTAAHSYVVVSHSKKEHAYAKVVHGSAHEPETDTDNYDDPEMLKKDTRVKMSDNLQKTSNLQTSQSADTNRSSIPEPAIDQSISVVTAPEPVVIPAAMAISGRTRANEELPYMTPASIQTSTQPQQNYSGDSHDSRGYTSISVREPLAALKARQQQEGRQTSAVAVPASKSHEAESEGYYMTVSDDSADETYACIDENSRNGGSETYARINLPPTVAANQGANTAGTLISPTAQESSPPAPPSVDSLKHVVHSRQASAGSAASTGLSSPNAERRVTKSPLPPVPQGDPDIYSKDTQDPSQKPAVEVVTRVTDSTGSRPLEEMYAKVNKKRSSHSRGSSSGGPDNDVLSNNSSRRNSTDLSKQLSSPTNTKPIIMSSSLIETSTENKIRNVPSDLSMSWSAVHTCPVKMPQTKTYSRETSDPGYETVKSTDPPYASVDQPENYPSYEVVRHQGTSDIESEHGYETLRHKEFEPGYETVHEVVKSCQSRYRNSAGTSDYEAGYETVNRSTDAGYESVQSHGKGDYDPGYEELSGVHARSTSECDPNYEQLKFNTSESGYEAVSKRSEGNYELVSDYETQERPPVSSDAGMPLYATVNKKGKTSVMSEGSKEDTGLDILDNMLKSTESEHISLIQVSDSYNQDVKMDHFVPHVTGAIIKCNQETLNLTDLPTKPTDTYPVIESPEDVELPPPELESIDALTASAQLTYGVDSSIPSMMPASQDSTDLLGSFAGTAKALDVDLITGCLSNYGISPELASVLSVQPVTGIKSKTDVNTADLMGGDTGTQIDLLSEALPPPPTSMFDDMSTHIMPLPPPVDDICGNHEILSQDSPNVSVTNSVSCAASQADTIPSTKLDDFMPQAVNGSVNGLLEDIQLPESVSDFPSLMDVPPPPQLDAIEASLAASNGGTITVTVNPMARMEGRAAPPTVSSLIRAALSSESSGSTANGGSVESVVTVDVKNGTEVSTSVPPTNSTPQPAQPPPPSTSEAKDSHEGLTPV